MAGASVESDDGALVLVAARDARQRSLGPGNSCRRSTRRLRLTRRPTLGGQADRAAERGPGAERGIVLLESPENTEPEHEENHEQHRRPLPGKAGPGHIEP